MNNLLTSPVGIDKTIQFVQTNLYNELASIWGGAICGYGLVQKNPSYTKGEEPDYHVTSETVFPEWYDASKKDYTDVYFDDTKGCVFCFTKEDIDRTDDSILFKTRVKAIFSVDLTKIFPNETELVISMAHRDVIEVLRNFNGGFNIKGIEQRLEVVWTGFNTSRMRFDDMYPKHCFAVNLDLEYYLTDKCV